MCLWTAYELGPKNYRVENLEFVYDGYYVLIDQTEDVVGINVLDALE